MYHYSATANPSWIKPTTSWLTNNSNRPSHETTFDPFRYEFDPETMIEPFTYFNNGPTESRPKVSEFPSPSSGQYSWLSASSRSSQSSPDEFASNQGSPTISEPVKKRTNHGQPTAQSSSSYPKTICRHCKSHNMPECLYTSHTMYDESGAIFCPVLKKCHCATCVRVTNPPSLRDDDSDDENSIRLPAMTDPWNRSYDLDLRDQPYSIRHHNNTF